MIPTPGDVFRHEDGSLIQIREVATGPFRVEFAYGTHLCEANAEGWLELLSKLTRVAELPRFQLVTAVANDLKLMQGLEKDFVVQSGDVPLGILGHREDVTVMVARGGLAPWLKQLGIKIHKIILEQKNGTQEENLN